MTYAIYNSGLDRAFISDTHSFPPISTYYLNKVSAISAITGEKLYDYVDDIASITQVFPLSFAPVVPPTGTNLLYVGSNQPIDVRFYDGTGTERTITGMYYGSTLVWQQ